MTLRGKWPRRVKCKCGQQFLRTHEFASVACGRCRAEKADRRAQTLPAPKESRTAFTCDNCFKSFFREGSGRAVFCDACEPWFNTDRTVTAFDHAAEQERARKVQGRTRAETIIEGWLRQG